MTECENKEIALLSENVLVVISHLQKKIFTWIGEQAAPHSKFACARETARIRMELGYKIVNLEETETTDEFLEAVDEACNATPTTKPKPAAKPAAKPKPKTTPKTTTKTAAKPKPKTTPKTTTKTAAKPKPKAEPKKEVVPAEEEERRYSTAAVETTLIDIEHILKQLEVLQPIEGKIRDYVVIGDTLYISPENLDKSNTESKVSLPDGSFIAEDYISRLFLEDGKIIAMELWRDN